MSQKSGKSTPKLSDCEWEVMKPFWEHGAMAARDLFAALPEGHGWTYRTVKTLLARLVKKGALGYQQVGNSYLYRAEWTREELASAETASFVQRIFDGALPSFLMQFAETASEDEIRVARKQLKILEEEKRKRGKSNE
jgi:BlaI family transcriptional regulator, penicillinase repressor